MILLLKPYWIDHVFHWIERKKTWSIRYASAYSVSILWKFHICSKGHSHFGYVGWFYWLKSINMVNRIKAMLKAIAHKIQQRIQGHDLRISLRPLGVLSWMSVITLLRWTSWCRIHRKSYLRSWPVKLCWLLTAQAQLLKDTSYAKGKKQ